MRVGRLCSCFPLFTDIKDVCVINKERYTEVEERDGNNEMSLTEYHETGFGYLLLKSLNGFH